jgi:hypothetical protein
MHGYITQDMKALGAEPMVIWGSFAPNAASTPSAASNEGPPGVVAFTTAYAATGAFTVTLPAGCVPIGTPHIFVSAQCESLTEHFAVCVTGAYSPTARTFTIQAHRNGTGREVAAHANARIHFALFFNNSTGA